MHCLKLSPGARIYATAHNGSFLIRFTRFHVSTRIGLANYDLGFNPCRIRRCLAHHLGLCGTASAARGGAAAEKQQAAYAIYERNTRVNALTTDNSAEPTPTQQERQNAWEEARQIRKFLLEHPSVTPGPGFSAPGVQTTGAAIVRAIDNAQER